MKIVYQNQNDEVVIIMPCECGLTIEQIAQKDVPYNAPYLIVEDSDLPADWSTSAAWEADFSSPSGIGMGPQRYFIQKAQQEIAQGINVQYNEALILQMEAELQ